MDTCKLMRVRPHPLLLSLLAAAACLAANGCAHVTYVNPRLTRVVDEEKRVWTEDKAREVPGARLVEMTPWEHGRRVSLTVRRTMTCVSESITHVEVKKKVLYQTQWTATAPWLGVAASALGLGTYFSATAGHRPRIFHPVSRGELSREGSHVLGLSLIGAGAAAAAYAVRAIVTDGTRAEETEQTVLEPVPGSWDCGQRPEPGFELVARTWDGLETLLQTDGNGQAVFTVLPEQLKPPPPGQPWVTFNALYASTSAYTPPPEVFVALINDPSAEDLARFRARFPEAGEWEELAKGRPTGAAATERPDNRAQRPGPPEGVPEGSPLAGILGGASAPPPNLTALMEMRVIEYFELDTKYATEEERGLYRQTEDYSKRIAELKAIKDTTMATVFYTQLDATVDRYDVARRQLELGRGTNWGARVEQAVMPKSRDSLYFTNLPSKLKPREAQVPRRKGWPGPQAEVIQIAVQPQQAIQITDNKAEVDVYLTFRPSGVQQHRMKYLTTTDNRLHALERKLVECRVERLFIANRASGEVYYEHVFQ